ncbi:PD-(D/E)XK nuclease family protein [Micromonospora aurantiaca (nom. illeg.)]|uniref:RecB family exonuclease n=1 Tax=Micromonospora aurantiaca (nom. illeg.) TaxID=47850 RepID=UPI003DA398B3
MAGARPARGAPARWRAVVPDGGAGPLHRPATAVAAARPAHGRCADRRARRGPAAAPPAGGRPAAAPAALRARTRPAGRGGGGRAAALPAGRGRPAGRTAAAPGVAGAGAGRRRPPSLRRAAGGGTSRPGRTGHHRASLGGPRAGRGAPARDRPGDGRPARRHSRGRALGGVAGERAGRTLGRGDHPGRAATGEHETAQRWRAEAADRDLDAVLVLFDAAARFTDRLPGARTEVFLDHVLGQELPADTLAAAADRGDAVRLLTAHAAKGLEWDLVAVAGVQEGVWPDLRLRGSLLGSERLVDVLAGRADGAGLRASLVGQTSALLDEERRLFHVAISRARRRLLVTAVASAAVGGDDHEEQPSRFLHELAAADPPATGGGGTAPTGPNPTGPNPNGPNPTGNGPTRTATRGGIVDGPVPHGDEHPQDGPPAALPVTLPPRGLTLSALVAELRTAVTDPATPITRRHAAAGELARLAAAGVPGAHPDDWWGLRGLSDDRPLVDEGEPVRVTPSAMESALRCSLRWLLERHGGSGPASAAQGVGNLVHAAAMLAEDASVDREALLEYVAARFDAIELAARWMAGPERQRAEAMVDKLLRWLAGNPRRLLAIEHEFAVRLDDPSRPVELTGRVDRLEVDDEGRLVVIDLKTGKSTAVTEREVAEHPQLGAYQAAVEAGGFAEFGEEPGGAALVQLGTGARDAKEQTQAAAGEGPEAGWATALVRRTADTMAASTFAAVANSKCRVCPVRTSCPVSGQGRQVVEPPPENQP